MEQLDSVARRYGRRPSEIVGEPNPFVALSIDLWAHNWGVQAEARAVWEAQNKARRGRRGR